jgi:TIR domain
MATVFISYCREDHKALEEVQTFLRGARLEDHDVWSDQRLETGQDWRAEIDRALQTARVGILLISARFLASRFIMNQEVRELLRRRHDEGITIFPVILDYCTWTAHPSIKAMQVRPSDDRPLADRTKTRRNKELAALALEVLKVVDPDADRHEAEARPPRAERAPLEHHVGERAGARVASSSVAVDDLSKRNLPETRTGVGEPLFPRRSTTTWVDAR